MSPPSDCTKQIDAQRTGSPPLSSSVGLFIDFTPVGAEATRLSIRLQRDMHCSGESGKAASDDVPEETLVYWNRHKQSALHVSVKRAVNILTGYPKPKELEVLFEMGRGPLWFAIVDKLAEIAFHAGWITEA